MTARSIASYLVVLSCAVMSAQTRVALRIERAAWLQGCWAITTPDRSVEEAWTAPKGGAMIGVGRTIREGKMTSYEMIVLRELEVSASEVVFENAEHDFPQQVGYRRNGDALLAWISGKQKGVYRRVEFPYTRVRCDEP
jgi:hypothetical protein